MKSQRICPHHSCPLYGVPFDEDINFCPDCGAKMVFKNTTIVVHGRNAKEVQIVAATLYSKAIKNDQRTPWLSGLFYLLAFVMVVATLLGVGKILPLIALPLVAIGGVIIFSVIGAFILRYDKRLSEKSFLDLMKLAFKVLPMMRKDK